MLPWDGDDVLLIQENIIVSGDLLWLLEMILMDVFQGVSINHHL